MWYNINIKFNRPNDNRRGQKMSVELELKNNGIEVVNEIDNELVEKIAKEVSHKIYETFPNYGLSEDDLYNIILKLKMCKAKMQERNKWSKLLL